MVLSQFFSEQNPEKNAEKKTVTAPFFKKKMVLSEFFRSKTPGENAEKKTVTAPFLYKNGAVTFFFGSRPVLKLRKQGQNIWAL